MATEVFEFVLKLRDEASGPLDSARSKAQSLGGASERVGKQVEALRKAQLDLASAINVAAQATERDEGKLHALKLELEATTRELNRLTGAKQQAAAASSSLSSSIGSLPGATNAAAAGMGNFGRAGLEVSRAIEDAQYGIAGVVNNIPGLVAALGGGAGVAGIASIAAVAVAQLVKHWDDLGPASNKAAAAARESITSLVEDIAKAREEMDALARGTSTELIQAEKAMAERQRTFDDAVTRFGTERFKQGETALAGKPQLLGVEHLDREIAKERKVFIDPDVQKAFDDLLTLQQDLALANEKRFLVENKLEAERVAAAEKEIERAEKSASKRSLVGERAAKKDAEREAKEKEDSLREIIDREEKFAEQERRFAEEEKRASDAQWAEIEKAQKAHDAEMAKLRRDEAREFERMEREKTRVAAEAARERERTAKREAQQIVGLYADVSGALVQAGVAIAQGQDDAVATLVAALSREAGGFVTLKGAELAAQGIAAAAGGNPAGVGQAAIGLGLVTAGQAITYGGPAVAASIFGGGGSSGGASSGARTTSGASAPRSSSTSTSSEPGITEINVYFGGPPVGRARENVAIDLNDAERRNNRRGRRR
jgi:hypothetical protein